jgi:nucleoside 2-deoxyribosyltransferase
LIEIAFQSHGKIIDTPTADAFAFVVNGLLASGVLEAPRHTGDRWLATLSFAGWARFEDLRRGAPSGRNAFMAMQYGDAALDRIVTEYFRPAVKQTGFNLKRLDDEPKAGLLDARMMLEIQGAWLVVADLTHGNHGAYWEAGYAAGLRKPVIYTCERSAWAERKSHFDTNHHLHVVWDANDMPKAVRELKATIRFTLPEAKQQDDA